MWCAIVVTAIFPPVCSLPDRATHVRIPRRIGTPAAWYRFIVAGALGGFAFCALSASAISRITISADSIEGKGWQVTQPSLELKIGPTATGEVKAKRVAIGETQLDFAALRCASLIIAPSSIDCKQGIVSLGTESLPFVLSFDRSRSRFNLFSELDTGERWSLQGELQGGAKASWNALLETRKGQVKRFARWLAVDLPAPSAGELNGRLTATGDGSVLVSFNTDLKMNGVAFSDAAGLKAGEKLDFALRAEGKTVESRMDWTFAADYLAGEIFWQPVYIAKGGHRIEARGTLTWAADEKVGSVLNVAAGKIAFADIGDTTFSGTASLSPVTVKDGMIKTGPLNAAALFDTVVKPFFDKSTLGEVSAKGMLSFDGVIKEGQWQRIDARIDDVTINDPRGRFVVNRLSATLPWKRDELGEASVSMASGALLNIPIGRISFPVFLGKEGFVAQNIAVPVLDGTLDVKVLSGQRTAGKDDAEWTWRLDSNLSAISMESLTTALKWPVMKGVLRGNLSEIIYANGKVTVNGELDIGVFDGKVRGYDIALLDPLGRAPRFIGQFEARALDLALVTSTFSFGRMEGRVDVDLRHLELANWKPVQFDGDLHSSPGDYPKKISQQAVQNISSLGGAGAGAALQRGMLSFFEQFGYQKLGLSCKLRNGICEMGGVENTPQGYVIVKGGGIPSITVMGYNQNVSWETLVSRVQSAISGNTKPVIQ